MRKRTCRVVPAELLETLHDILKAESYTTAELAELTGYKDAAVRTRLLILEERGQIHHTTQCSSNGVGMTYIWHAGAKRVRVAANSRTSIVRRDPLVAALFGQPIPHSQGA